MDSSRDLPDGMITINQQRRGQDLNQGSVYGESEGLERELNKEYKGLGDYGMWRTDTKEGKIENDFQFRWWCGYSGCWST